MKREKYRLLLVEDEVDLRETICSLLVDDGYDCVEASNGIEAQAFLKKEKFDLILTDNRMARMNGVALLAWCRGCQLTLPAILLTGDLLGCATCEALRTKLNIKIISKPSSFDAISEAIHSALIDGDGNN